MGVLMLLCLTGIVIILQKQRERERLYEEWMERAEKAVDPDEKQKEVEQAILLYPAKIEGYDLLVEIFKIDGKFVMEEEQKLLSLLEYGGRKLKDQKGYARLAFQIGKLYWHYYIYGEETLPEIGQVSDNELTRMKAAVPWFEEAGKGELSEVQSRQAAVYSQVGIFYRDLALRVREGTEKGAYLDLWENLCRLEEEIQGEEDLTETARLEFYLMCIRSINSYHHTFLEEGISEKEVSEFLKELMETAEQMEVSTERGKVLQERMQAEWTEKGGIDE